MRAPPRPARSTCFHEPVRLRCPRLVGVVLLLLVALLSSVPVHASILPFGVSPGSAPALHAPLVLFQRAFQRDPSAPLQNIAETRQEEVFLIEHVFRDPNAVVWLHCSASVNGNVTATLSAPTNYTSEPEGVVPVFWRTEDGRRLSVNGTLRVVRPLHEISLRCEADVAGVFPELGNASVPSRAVHFRHRPMATVTVHPDTYHVAPGATIRLTCRWPQDLAQRVVWKHNGRIVTRSRTVRFESIGGKSVLHVLAAASEHAGEYRCVPVDAVRNAVDGPATVHLNASAPTPPPTDLPSYIEATADSDLLLECLGPELRSVRWLFEKTEDAGGTAPPKPLPLGNGTIIALRKVARNFAGIVKCVRESANGSTSTGKSELKVFERASPDVAEYGFTEVLRKQGTPITHRCETFDTLGETPEDALWLRDGHPVQRSPNVKIVRSEQNGVGAADLIFAIAGSEDAGLYTCVVSSPSRERHRQLLVRVEVTTHDLIHSVRVGVDHEDACMKVMYVLPSGTELQWALFTTYFFVYYEVQDPEASLNSMPVRGNCNSRLRCHFEICADKDLKAATEYVVRLSMVMSGSNTVITPLSEPVHVTTWDGMAPRSLPIDVAFLEEEAAVLVSWEPPVPSDLPGRVTKYFVQTSDYSDKLTDLLSGNPRDSHYVPARTRSLRIANVSRPFAFKIRVVPVTRADKLPFVDMGKLEFFPFLLFTSNDQGYSAATADDLPAPRFQLRQTDLLPSIEVSWSAPNESLDVSKASIRYQHVLQSRSRFVVIERDVALGHTQLTKAVEPGFVYQVCMAFLRHNAHGDWHCDAVPVRDQAGKLAFANQADLVKKKQLPPAIICGPGNCRCSPSEQVKGGMHVEWDVPPPAEGVRRGEITYVVHYTLNETDSGGKSSETQKSSETFVELPPLLPNATYRIMITSMNELNDNVDGTYFSCFTPLHADLPAPANFGYTLLNSSHVELYWTPLNLGDHAGLVDGYSVVWQVDGRAPKKIFVPGAKSEALVMSNMHPQSLYQAMIVSHSPTLGDSSIQSPVLFIRLPPTLTPSTRGRPVPGSGRTMPPAYHFLHSTTVVAYFVCGFSLCVLVVLLVLLLVIYLRRNGCFACFVAFRRWRQQRLEQKEEEALRKLSVTSTADSTLATPHVEYPDGSHDRWGKLMFWRGRVSTEPADVPLLNLPPDPPSFATLVKDPTGPSDVKRRVLRSTRKSEHRIRTKRFRQMQNEINKDPSGIGLAALARDQVYAAAHAQHDQILAQIFERERQAIAERQQARRALSQNAVRTPKTTGTEMAALVQAAHTPTSHAEVAETSFIEFQQVTPPASLHDDAVSASSDEPPPSKRPQASLSLNQLNHCGQNGLSPRSHSMAIYRRFFPKKHVAPTPDTHAAIACAGAVSLTSGHPSPPHSPACSSGDAHPPASSLPNLADSGIVFDEHHNGHCLPHHLHHHHHQQQPLLPTLRQTSRSGSATLCEDSLTPVSVPHHHHQHQTVTSPRLANGGDAVVRVCGPRNGLAAAKATGPSALYSLFS